MAQQVNTMLIDDKDGSRADETVAFGLDGRQYEIDLSRANAESLRAIFDPFVAAGRRQRRGRRRVTTPRAGSGGRERNQAIREWARQEGMQVSSRGRIPVEIAIRYDNQTS
jgi:hypothetical protein